MAARSSSAGATAPAASRRARIWRARLLDAASPGVGGSAWRKEGSGPGMFVKSRKALLFAAISTAALIAAPGAMAQTPSVNEGAPGGPLTQVSIGNDLSCQVQHTGDTSLELFPSSSTPGDCGTFVAVGGTLYTPDFSNHGRTATTGLGTRTPFSPVSQTPVSGSGSSSSPFRVTTIVTLGSTGLQITEIDSYVAGQESYRTDIQVKNTGGGNQSVVLYRAGDC